MDRIKCYFGLDDVSKVADKVFKDKLISILNVLHDEDVCVLEEIFSNIFAYLFHTTEDKYIKEFLLKRRHENLNRSMITAMLGNADYDKPICACGEMACIQRKFPHLFIKTNEDLNAVKAYFLSTKKDFRNIDSDFIYCFPNIFFYQKADMSVFRLDDLAEIIKALDLLNQKGMAIYCECNKDGGEAIKIFNTIVTCSGENNAAKCDVEIHVNDVKHTINVSPHFKIGRRDSNKRIYFAWGNINELNNRIVVYSIGGHIFK